LTEILPLGASGWRVRRAAARACAGEFGAHDASWRRLGRRRATQLTAGTLRSSAPPARIIGLSTEEAAVRRRSKKAPSHPHRPRPERSRPSLSLPPQPQPASAASASTFLSLPAAAARRRARSSGGSARVEEAWAALYGARAGGGCERAVQRRWRRRCGLCCGEARGVDAVRWQRWRGPWSSATVKAFVVYSV
jgi:hypothetical protein